MIPEHIGQIIHEVNHLWPAMTVQQRILDAQKKLAPWLVFTTSFGLEDQVITHEIFRCGAQVKMVTLDTGRMFEETYQLWEETEKRFQLGIEAFYPDQSSLFQLVKSQGVNGFRDSVEARKKCCQIRKVDPLKAALQGQHGWLTGLRRDQTSARSLMGFAHWEGGFELIKLSPLLDWNDEMVRQYIFLNETPYNSLHDQGYSSIGCAPCTRAVRVGESPRAGRWWWEPVSSGGSECGLHLEKLDEQKIILQNKGSHAPDSEYS